MRFILPFLFFFSTLAMSQDYPDYFRYQVLSTDKTSSTVTKQSFETIPRIILALHANELKSAGKTVEVNTKWEEPYFVGNAKELAPMKYEINFFGGIARIPEMNDEGYALIVCHELGHVLGEGKRITLRDMTWASSEGQSDYYASAVCVKKYFKLQHQIKKLSIPKEVPEISFTLCRTTYPDETDYLICLHTSKGILAYKTVLAHVGGNQEVLLIETPSPYTSPKTLINETPERQCRIDTVFQGSLCLREKYPCRPGEIGARPACWFRD